MESNKKICCGCKQSKLLNEFHYSKAHKQGRSPRCKSCGIQISSQWYRNNKDRKRIYDAKRRAEKWHLYREASKRFRINNPSAKNADTQTRRAFMRGAFPKWANAFFIKEIYALAALRTRTCGQRWVVDHIIPLRGKHVCGLHVENNLQVILETENRKKRNIFVVA